MLILASTRVTATFRDEFVELFDRHFPRLFRYLDRLAGDPELAADLAQDAFVRLHERGSMPDAPQAWLVTVAMNLFRNSRSMRSRRARLMTAARAESVLADPPRSPAEATAGADERSRVRAALQRLPQREREMLLLHAEGYRYREIALALGLNEVSVGTLLARAKQAFRQAFAEGGDAPPG